MFLRIMMGVGLATLALALFMLARVSHSDRPSLSPKPLGTSTLSHGGPSSAQPSPGIPDRQGDDMREQDRGGSTR
jgi:hypothetical protein